MKRLNIHAKNFVDGIVDHLKTDGSKTKPFTKVQSLLKKVSQDAWNKETAVVRSVVPLTDEEKEALVDGLSKRLQYPVTLDCRIDPELLAGMRIEIADLIIDVSFQEQLRSIESLLLKGNTV